MSNFSATIGLTFSITHNDTVATARQSHRQSSHYSVSFKSVMFAAELVFHQTQANQTSVSISALIKFSSSWLSFLAINWFVFAMLR